MNGIVWEDPPKEARVPLGDVVVAAMSNTGKWAKYTGVFRRSVVKAITDGGFDPVHFEFRTTWEATGSGIRDRTSVVYFRFIGGES